MSGSKEAPPIRLSTVRLGQGQYEGVGLGNRLLFGSKFRDCSQIMSATKEGRFGLKILTIADKGGKGGQTNADNH